MDSPPRRFPTRLALLLLAGLPLLPVAAQRGTGFQAEREVQRAWSVDLGAARGVTITGVYPAGDLVLVADHGHGLSALRGDDGALQWFVQLPGPLTGTPARHAGLITLGSGDHVLVVEARSGRRVFQQRLPGPLAAAPRSDGERVFVPLLVDHRLAVIDMATGRPAWDVRLPTPFVTAPVLIDGRVLVVATEDGLRGFVADLEGRGRQAWVRPTGRPLGRLLVDGSRVLFTTAGRELLAVEGASGRVAWRVLPGERTRVEPVLVGDVVAQATDAGLIAVDAASGRTLWSQPGEKPLAALGGMLLVQRADGQRATRDADTGMLLDGGGRLPDWQALDAQRVFDVRGGELRVWSTAR